MKSVNEGFVRNVLGRPGSDLLSHVLMTQYHRR